MTRRKLEKYEKLWERSGPVPSPSAGDAASTRVALTTAPEGAADVSRAPAAVQSEVETISFGVKPKEPISPPGAREPGAREPGAREPGAREPGAREPGAAALADPEAARDAALAQRQRDLTAAVESRLRERVAHC